MLKRKLGQFVYINPYYDITGTIIDTRESTTDHSFNKTFDYKVKWNQEMEKGLGEWEYFREDELDYLENNWNLVKLSS